MLLCQHVILYWETMTGLPTIGCVANRALVCTSEALHGTCMHTLAHWGRSSPCQCFYVLVMAIQLWYMSQRHVALMLLHYWHTVYACSAAEPFHILISSCSFETSFVLHAKLLKVGSLLWVWD